MKKISELFNVTGYGVVVTGGASGIGLALTEALAANGARVTMLDVHAQRIENETKRLREAEELFQIVKSTGKLRWSRPPYLIKPKPRGP